MNNIVFIFLAGREEFRLTADQKLWDSTDFGGGILS